MAAFIIAIVFMKIIIQGRVPVRLGLIPGTTGNKAGDHAQEQGLEGKSPSLPLPRSKKIAIISTHDI